MRENGHRSHAFNKIENRARLAARLDLPTVYVSAGQLKVFRSPSGTARGTAAGEVSASAVSVRLRRGPGSAGALASVLRRKSRRIGRLFRNRQETLLARGSQPGRCGVGTAGGLAGGGEGTAETGEPCRRGRRNGCNSGNMLGSASCYTSPTISTKGSSRKSSKTRNSSSTPRLSSGK